MTEAWKVGDVGVINRRHPVEEFVGCAVAYKEVFKAGPLMVVVVAATGEEILAFEHELERP